MKYVTLDIYVQELIDTCDEMMEFIDYARRHPNAILLPDIPTLQKIDQWAKVIDEKKQGTKSKIVNSDVDRYI